MLIKPWALALLALNPRQVRQDRLNLATSEANSHQNYNFLTALIVADIAVCPL